MFQPVSLLYLYDNTEFRLVNGLLQLFVSTYSERRMLGYECVATRHLVKIAL
jgi:hypothetical protein